MTSRQGANVFWYMFGKYPAGNWRFPTFVKMKLWKSEYFFHDSFGVYFNRLVGCKFGHRNLNIVNWGNGVESHYCFACHKDIKDEEI